MMINTYLRLFSLLCLSCMLSFTSTAQETPNILLIIADDLGVDVSNGYQDNMRMPVTPNLDALRANGLTFKNAWAAPACTPTRAAIMSGKYGVKTGVLAPPGNLDLEHTSIFTALAAQTENAYAGAVIGKWHISQPVDLMHPAQHGIDHYEGIFGASVADYYNWTKVTNGVTTTETEYTTSNFTNGAIDWVNAQSQPWFLWLAHAAPHSPFQTPPEELYTSPQVNNNLQKYIAMIEAMDTEIGRLLASIPEEELDNTLIIYVGDNGTPGNIIQNFPNNHAKGTLYQGGIHVPLIVSGAGVTRMGEEEEALIHVNDLYATILEVAGDEELPGGIYNSLSFDHLLTGEAGPIRPYNYSETTTSSVDGWTIRNARYKLMNYNGTQEFYDLIADPIETTDLLLVGLTTEQLVIKAELEAEAEALRIRWSCADLIQNGDELGIDCEGSYCSDCISAADQIVVPVAIRVYPNPATDVIQIDLGDYSEEVIRLEIINNLGQQVRAIDNSFAAPILQQGITDLPSGVYFLRVTDRNGAVKAVSFCVE